MQQPAANSTSSIYWIDPLDAFFVSKSSLTEQHASMKLDGINYPSVPFNCRETRCSQSRQNHRPVVGSTTSVEISTLSLVWVHWPDLLAYGSCGESTLPALW
jgi:hypothetical protein